ncbi:M23 family metallopeptidase [Aestuariivirga sp.]|uniref:M23 family metallopeptidase n=1 Tax=Aestuariivirga sp. TaxID=2650926 RepID=UPI0039E439C8
MVSPSHTGFLFLALLFIVVPAEASDLSLGSPVSCDIGKTCWIQQYADHDGGPGARDYACGNETYDGHDGTDFRVLDTLHTAPVIASAPGIVKAVRDGVPDHLAVTDEDRRAVANIECGNGVLIDHGAGWQTQYCHLKRGSVVVRPGDQVRRGEKLGAIGYSGLAAFPHVHLTVRKDGKSVDPFHPSAERDCGIGGPELWAPETAAAFAYVRGNVLRLGFAPGPLTLDSLVAGEISDTGAPKPGWPALVAYVWVINLEQGDEVIVALEGPSGSHAENRDVLPRSKAQYLLFAGVPKPMPGTYRASFRIIRSGQTYLERSWIGVVN